MVYKDCTGQPVYLLNSLSVGPDAELNKPIESPDYSFSGTWMADKYRIYKPNLSTAPFINSSPQPVPSDWGIGLAYVQISGRNRACTGESVYLTSLVIDAISKLSYQWQISSDGKGWTKLEGKASSDCRTSELNTTTHFRLIATDEQTGIAQTSNELTVAVADAVINITGTSPVCKGGSVELTALSNEGVTGAGYSWQQSDDNNTWSDALPASSPTFKSATLNNASYFRCIYKPGSGFCKETTSEVFAVTLAEPPTVTASATSTICKGGTAEISALVSGGKAKGTFQWQSADEKGEWKNSSGQTAANYTTLPLLSNTDFRTLFTPAITGCAPVASNIVSVKITDAPKITAKGNATIINERVVALRAKGEWNQPASYQWQQSITGTKWLDMPADTFAAAHPKVTSTTYFRCLYKSPVSGCEGISNTITVEMPMKQQPLSAYSDVKHWDPRSHNPKKLLHLGVDAGLAFNYQPLRVAYQQFPDSAVTVNAKALGLHAGFVFHPVFKNYFSLGFILSGDVGSTPMLFKGGKSSKNSVSIKETYLFTKFNAGTEVAFGFRALKFMVKYNMSMQTNRFNRSEQQEGSDYKNYSANYGLRKETIGMGFRVGTYSAIKSDREPFCADAMLTLSNDYRFDYGKPWGYKSLSGWQLGFETGFWFQSYFRMAFGMSFYDGAPAYLYPNNKKQPSLYLTLAYSRDWFR